MDSQVFDLLMKRFDTLEAQGTETQTLVRDHTHSPSKEDLSYRKVVDRHSTYWTITTGGLTFVAASVLGWFGIKS